MAEAEKGYIRVLRNADMAQIQRGAEHILKTVELHAQLGGSPQVAVDMMAVLGLTLGVLVLERQREGFSAPGYNRSVTVENDGSLITWNACGDDDDPHHDPTIFAALATALKNKEQLASVLGD